MLVRNLYNEGNDLYREGNKRDSVNQYLEALSIADYASSEDICIPNKILERLYLNRAACYLDMGFHESALNDCEAVLKWNNNNFKALYRKSKSLFMLEQYKEAYDAVARCSLTAPQDERVVKLTQDLAVKLGLKVRKAYVRAQSALHNPPVETEKNADCLAEQIEPDLPEVNYDSPLSPPPPLMYPSAELGTFPSALVSNGTFPVVCGRYLDGDVIGAELDEILDSVPEPSDINLSGSAVSDHLQRRAQSLPFPSALLDSPPGLSSFASSVTLSDRYSRSLTSSLDSFSLKSLSLSDSQADLSTLGKMNGALKSSVAETSPFLMGDSSYLFRNDSPTPFSANPIKPLEIAGNEALPVSNNVPLINTNPLEETHEFKQACQLCFTKAGLSNHTTLDQKCKKDILLGRITSSADKSWKRIRPRPTKNQYVGPFYICKDVAAGNECTYPGHCTFAYCQEEIDVWTLERKGAFCRESLFGGNGKVSLTIPYLLQEYPGTFMFLCEKCFDHKPRIISEENKENSLYCLHPVSKHYFEDNKCLVHRLMETTVKYCKIRPFNNHLVLDLCRHEVRYGCLREDDCFYAHSMVELRVWIMQKETGISFETIVLESKICSKPESAASQSQAIIVQNNPGYPNIKIKFVCGQCWRNGQVIESDKNKKYCSAKARHPWTKERRVVLVMSNERKKWISIRPFPTKKPIPVHFEMCNHIVSGKKCQYIGNCSFAHSPEEKTMWTYMKETGIQDLEQLYEKLLKDERVEKGDEASAHVNKQIHLPTDYAEPSVDFHCWLCGKNCNSERQWKAHISSDKHKEKVFHCEDDQNIWQHRFPTGHFAVCERFLSGKCSEGEKCKFAHGKAELKEWEERRQVLRQKLIKARKDLLISPDDNDFGKYSFLINDLN
ncbi:zinc finger CCCH domain-containing protein 7A isoform X2 [Bombina bombina]|nr:zinc finger CCCH domain-containing protein 7A isoform X2 [Bombina bombina]